MKRLSLTQDDRAYRERSLSATDGASGKAVLVLRYQHNGKEFTRVWRGWSYYHVIVAAHAAATRAYAGRTVRKKRWGARQDALVLEHYRSTSKSKIAAMLSEKFKQRYSKNMVISRYHRLTEKERRNDG